MTTPAPTGMICEQYPQYAGDFIPNHTDKADVLARLHTGEWVPVCDGCYRSDEVWYAEGDIGPSAIPLVGPTWMTVWIGEHSDPVTGTVWLDIRNSKIAVAYESDDRFLSPADAPDQLISVGLDELTGPDARRVKLHIEVDVPKDTTDLDVIGQIVDLFANCSTDDHLRLRYTDVAPA